MYSSNKELASRSLTLCISLCVDCALEISLQTEITRFLHALKQGRKKSFENSMVIRRRTEENLWRNFVVPKLKSQLAGAARFHLRNCVAPCIRNFPSGCKVVIPPSSCGLYGRGPCTGWLSPNSAVTYFKEKRPIAHGNGI